MKVCLRDSLIFLWRDLPLIVFAKVMKCSRGKPGQGESYGETFLSSVLKYSDLHRTTKDTYCIGIIHGISDCLAGKCMGSELSSLTRRNVSRFVKLESTSF